MQAHRQAFRVKAMAPVLGVARSQLCTWCQRQVTPCRRKTERQERKEFQQLLRDHELRSSLSAKGNCYDNACAERTTPAPKTSSIP